MEFYLKFDMGASIHDQLLKPTEDCRLGSVSTGFTTNSFGMDDTSSRIHPSIYSNVIGLVEQTCSFNQPQGKKSQGAKSRTIHLPGKWAFSHSPTTVAKCGGAPSFMNIKSSMFLQELMTGQISSLSIVRYLLAFAVPQWIKGPTVGSCFSITLHTLIY